MTAIEPGSSRLLCDNGVYAALGVYSDYEELENPSIYAGRYPKHENETAISGNLAQALGKDIGDTVEVTWQRNGRQCMFIWRKELMQRNTAET